MPCLRALRQPRAAVLLLCLLGCASPATAEPRSAAGAGGARPAAEPAVAEEPGPGSGAPAIVSAVILHGLLLLLPGVAAAILGRRLRQVSNEGLVPVIVLASCAAGLLAFWVFFLSPIAGRVLSWGLYAASAGVVLWRTRAGGVRRLLVGFEAAAFGLALLCVLLGAAAGYAWGDLDEPLQAPTVRYTHRLPVDNLLPLLLADGVHEGRIRKPLIGDWLSSDRPPLQAAAFVVQMPLVGRLPLRSPAFRYQILAMWLQALWVPALLWFLRTAGVGRWTATATIAATAFSGFAIVNGFYVWPKLFAGALLLFPAARLLTGDDGGWKGSRAWGAMAGLAAGLAMLAHGTSFFGLAGMGLAALLLRRPPALRVTLVALAVAAAVYLPWVLYQKLYDPPGDRLAKWFLAGFIPVDERTLGEALADEYGRLSWAEIARHKVANVEALFEGAGESVRDLWTVVGPAAAAPERLAAAKVRLRHRSFFRVFPAFGLLNLGLVALPLALLARRPRAAPERRAALGIGLAVAASLAFWCLLGFGPATTVIHQGTYFTMLAGFAGLACALAAVSRPLLVAVAAANVWIGARVFFLTSPWSVTEPPGLPPLPPLDGTLTAVAWVAGAAFLAALVSPWVGRHFRRAGSPARAA